MRGTDTSILSALIGAANDWRNVAKTAGVDLFQINVAMPDGRPLVLKWEAEAVTKADGTHSGDWLIDS